MTNPNCPWMAAPEEFVGEGLPDTIEKEPTRGWESGGKNFKYWSPRIGRQQMFVTGTHSVNGFFWSSTYFCNKEYNGVTNK